MFKNFDKFNNIKYGISLKKDGPMKVVINSYNRSNFLNSSGLSQWEVVSPFQSHSNIVFEASKNQKEIKADALVAKESGVLLTVTAADCFPVYFFDPEKNVIALAHSGWRGTLNGLLGSTLTAMGSLPENILVGIGPGIQACHFEVKEDVLPKFAPYPKAISKKQGKIYIDLPKVIIEQLMARGVNADNIETVGDCTYCQSQNYFSFRRDKPQEVEPMMAYIGISG